METNRNVLGKVLLAALKVLIKLSGTVETAVCKAEDNQRCKIRDNALIDQRLAEHRLIEAELQVRDAKQALLDANKWAKAVRHITVV